MVKSMIRRQAKQRQPFSKVSRLGHKMTVTSVNKDVDIDGLNVKKGQELKVTKKDKKVTLSGDGKSKDITFSTKNDTKDKF